MQRLCKRIKERKRESTQKKHSCTTEEVGEMPLFTPNKTLYSEAQRKGTQLLKCTPQKGYLYTTTIVSRKLIVYVSLRETRDQ